MDLRLWVLVTGFDPLTGWLYEDFWIRLAMQDYDDDTLDPKKHLTNMSIAKKAITKSGGNAKAGLKQYMKGTGDFIDEYGLDTWEEKVKPQIKQITKSLFAAVQADFKNHRKNSFEYYGLDIMIDDSFRAWLLEINRNPYAGNASPSLKSLRHGNADVTTLMI